MKEDKTPSREEIKRVQEYLEAQAQTHDGRILPEEVNTISDYLKACSDLVTALAKCIASGNIKSNVESLFQSKNIREVEVVKIVNKYLYGEVE